MKTIREFCGTAIKIGKLLINLPAVDPTIRTDAAQWLLEPAEGAKRSDLGMPVGEPVAIVARAILENPAALDVLKTWNLLIEPDKDPLSYVREWAQKAD